MANLERIAMIINSLTSQISDAEEVLREEGVPCPKDFLAEAMSSQSPDPSRAPEGPFTKFERPHQPAEPTRKAGKRSPAHTN